MEQTPLGKRLARAARASDINWKFLVENVPVWPVAPPVPPYTWGDGDHRYAPSQGVEVLLDALHDRGQSQGVHVGTESILITNGGLDALGLTVRHLRRSGVSRAVCAGPILLSLAQLFDVTGLQLVVQPWSRLWSEQSWRLFRLGPGDVVYINTPHNPTGTCLENWIVKDLLKDQEHHGFALIFDLVYDSFTYGPQRFVSPLALVEEWRNVFGVNSFSKNYGAPGLRVGWLVTEPGTIADLTSHLEMERIAVSTEAQLRAAALCKHGNAPLVERVDHGHQLVVDWALEHGVRLDSVRSGTQAWLDLEAGDTERFADSLLVEDMMIVATGANYYPRDVDHIRVPTGLPASFLAEALQVIARARHRARCCHSNR
ncbi:MULTISPECIES: beta-methylarginine biosynthesis bifunctional aminotransferase [Sorangium]|uniref:Aminotransferase n=1 Tax=Sorangium cellulosum TaxID=56 RepID=A0A4V0NFE9_SORCE|nr:MULTISPECIES: beta-methylarginine biosynthesis bifunctional aminotransferase [Sorangium]AUX29432.1 aminotransferase [Sorangium cellulosum]WCQ88827.1 Aspartate aminotransferase [Sorangium sp. Soce836]